jgi:hypothetical protein
MQYCLFKGNGESVIVVAETIYSAMEWAKELFGNPQFITVLIESTAKTLVKQGVTIYEK